MTPLAVIAIVLAQFIALFMAFNAGYESGKKAERENSVGLQSKKK